MSSSETAALKRPFLVGLLASAIAFLILGGLIAVFATGDDRPEGTAERWLTAVADLTRKGVHSDAVRRVNAHGDASLADPLVGTGLNYDGKSAFTTLEVGKARRPDAVTALVPYKVTSRVPDDAKPQRGVLVLRRERDAWRVAELRPADAALRVPSDGGDVASKAPISVYAAALLLGVGVAVVASTLVRAAGREQDALQSAA